MLLAGSCRSFHRPDRTRRFTEDRELVASVAAECLTTVARGSYAFYAVLQIGTYEIEMRAITLRDIPPGLASVLEKEARATGTSLDKTVIRLLERATGLAGTNRYHDLDELAGSWTPEQAREFDGELAEQRKIDPELWGD